MGEDEEIETEEVEDHNLSLISLEDGARLKLSVRYIEY